jgi:hypothetical protein
MTAIDKQRAGVHPVPDGAAIAAAFKRHEFIDGHYLPPRMALGQAIPGQPYA